MRWHCLFITALALAGCSGLPPLPETSVSPYRLGVGDEVRIITFSEAQLSGAFHVDDSGRIALPLLGPVQASGLTATGLEDEIAGDLKANKLLVNPSVSVEVVSFRPISVIGEVGKPGEYPYRPGMTVLNAVALAGGFTYRAVQDHATVLRDEHGHTVRGQVDAEGEVHPGDVITVGERWF